MLHHKLVLWAIPLKANGTVLEGTSSWDFFHWMVIGAVTPYPFFFVISMYSVEIMIMSFESKWLHVNYFNGMQSSATGRHDRPSSWILSIAYQLSLFYWLSDSDLFLIVALLRLWLGLFHVIESSDNSITNSVLHLLCWCVKYNYILSRKKKRVNSMFRASGSTPSHMGTQNEWKPKHRLFDLHLWIRDTDL